MKTTLSSIAAAIALAVTTASAVAAPTLIDFEHADAGGIVGQVNYAVPVITQGFKFSTNMDVLDVTQGPWSGTGPAHSGHFATLNDWGGNMTMTAADGSTFELNDLWMHAWFGAGVGAHNQLVGYLNGVQVGLVDFVVGSDWVNVVANFSMVDSITLVSPYYFLVDDITVNAGAGNVPEPASLGLAGVALLGLLAARRARRA